MKKCLLQLAIGLSLVMFAASAFAGGAGCDSKKGAHKGMSAEAMKEHKDGHAWLMLEDQQNKGETKTSEDKSETKLIKL